MTMFQNLRRMMAGESATLKLECGKCGHKVAWTRKEAFWIFGPDAAPYDIRRRLRCGQCGERSVIGVSI
jgi:ribosomal protein S27AE